MHAHFVLLYLATVVAISAARAQYYPPRPSNPAILAMMSTAPSLHDASVPSDEFSASSSRHGRSPNFNNRDDDDDDDDETPIKLPATFDLLGTNQDLTLKADGSFTVACSPGKPCPVPPPTGRGEFLVNLEDNSILLFQMIDQDKQWVVRQTWVIGAQDLNSPVWSGNRLRAHHGDRSDEWPVPKSATVWKRRN
ncbi:hypothetical protein BCR44DRAFT_33612, partial [Catenaria anguillulae PL171]